MNSINDHIEISNGKMYLDGIDLNKLADKYKSPLFIFSEKRIIENIQYILGLTQKYYDEISLFYALKANSNINLLKIFKKYGVKAEVVSHGELYKALKAGFPPDEIIFNGPGKYPSGLEESVIKGIHVLNIDSLYELDLVSSIAHKVGKPVNVAFRIVPEVGAQVIETGLSWTKFGIEIDVAINAYKKALNDKYIQIKGIHGHLGSQILKIETWKYGTKALVDLANSLYDKLGIVLEHINMGGGFPNDYTITPINLKMDLAERFKPRISEETILKTMVDSIRGSKFKMKLYLELGRRLISDSGILISRAVNYKERINGEKWIILDTGFNLLLSNLLYKWYYPIVNLSRIESPHESPFRVAGPLCDTDDVFHDLEGEFKGEPMLPKYRLLPEKSWAGDLFAFFHVGAYTIEESSNYNSLPRAIMLLVQENGDIKIIRKRETLYDLITKEVDSQ